MTSAEYSEWLAWDRVGGVVDANLAQAQTSRVVSASFGGGKVPPLADFLLLATEARAERLTPEQTAGILGRTMADPDQQTPAKRPSRILGPRTKS